MTEIAATGEFSLLPTTPTKSAGVLEREDFLQIMISELANQDPFEPLDNKEFLGQLTQLQNLEATTGLSDSLEAFVLGQQLSSAGAVIGRYVRGVTPDQVAFYGTVDRVVIQDGEVLLGVGNYTARLADVEEVLAGPPEGAEGARDDPETPPPAGGNG